MTQTINVSIPIGVEFTPETLLDRSNLWQYQPDRRQRFPYVLTITHALFYEPTCTKYIVVDTFEELLDLIRGQVDKILDGHKTMIRSNSIVDKHYAFRVVDVDPDHDGAGCIGIRTSNLTADQLASVGKVIQEIIS